MKTLKVSDKIYEFLSENYNGFFDEFNITELQDIIQAMEDYHKSQSKGKTA